MTVSQADVAAQRPTEMNRDAGGFSARFLALLGALIVLKAILVVWAIQPLGDRTDHYNIGHNPDRYDALASNLVNGNGYRIFEDTNVTMFREPGYVLTLAAIFSVFGENAAVGRIANVLFSVTTLFLLVGIGRLAGVGDRATGVAAVLMLVHPAVVFAESRLGVEALLSLLIVAVLYTMLRAQTIRSPGAFALAGLVAAMTALTRSAVIPVFAVWVVYVLIVAWRERWLPAASRGLIVFTLCLAAVFSIWPVRNWLLSGQPVISATVAGDAWYFGMYLSRHRDDDGKEYFERIQDASAAAAAELALAGVPVQRDGFTQLHASVDDELRHQQVLTRAAWRAYRAEPTLWIRTIVRNVTAFWIQGRTSVATNLNAVLFAGTAVFALAGLLLAVRAGQRIVLLPLFIFSYYAIHLPILAAARYHVVLIPLLALLCGISLAEIYRVVTESDRSVRAVRRNRSS